MRLLRYFLAPLAPLYGLLVKARNRHFDRHPERCQQLSIPVIAIGNITAGGTGKSPITLFLAQELENEGLHSVILSRGYGGKRAIDPMDVNVDSNPAEVGDEPLMMAQRLGQDRVVVGRKRHAAGLRALSKVPKPDLFLLDDGFQHRALNRDLDLLLLDGVKTWGNGRMLPWGDLREGFEGATRAHALIVTRSARADRPQIEAWWARHGSGGPIFWTQFEIRSLRRHGAAKGEDDAGLGPFFAFCGLGHPEAFYADLLQAGFAWTGNHSFRDHQPYTLSMLRALVESAKQSGACALVCTEKDAVKIPLSVADTLDLPIYAAQQQVVGGEALLSFVMERLQSLLTSQSAPQK